MAFLFLGNLVNFIYQTLYHMSPLSFWTILIKVLGIYVLLQGLLQIPAFINMTQAIYYEGFQPYTKTNYFAWAYLLFLLGIFWLIIWACLFRTDWLINKLKLNAGVTEERLAFNMHRSDILKIVIMLIGGLTLVDALPAACQELFLCIQRIKEYNGFKKDPTSTYLLFHLLKIGIGIFMVTSNQLIVNYIERKEGNQMRIQ
ncbi:MAG: hypothetical protein ACTHNW_13095 [Mucilaginibacter sp.]